MNPLRIGIIGCGKIADGHADVLAHMPEAQLVAVCDREPILAEQLAVRYRIPAWYSDAQQMLERERLDVVHITTPPGAHLPLTQQCVDAGAHVFVEKPLALDAATGEALVATAEKAGRKLCINYWPNFDPPAMELKRLLAAGTIGDPVHVEAFIGYDMAGAYGQAVMSDPTHWVHHLPGKLFQNMLDHICNRITPFFHEDGMEVNAFAYKRREGVRGNSTDSLLDELRVYARSGTVSAYGTFCSHARPIANTLKVYGTKATVEVDFNNRTVVSTASQRYPSALGRLFPAFQMAGRYFKQGTHNLGMFRRHQFQYFAGMSELLSQFYAAIREDKPLPIPYSEIVKVARMMDSIHRQVYPVGGGVA